MGRLLVADRVSYVNDANYVHISTYFCLYGDTTFAYAFMSTIMIIEISIGRPTRVAVLFCLSSSYRHGRT